MPSAPIHFAPSAPKSLSLIFSICALSGAPSRSRALSGSTGDHLGCGWPAGHGQSLAAIRHAGGPRSVPTRRHRLASTSSRGTSRAPKRPLRPRNPWRASNSSPPPRAMRQRGNGNRQKACRSPPNIDLHHFVKCDPVGGGLKLHPIPAGVASRSDVRSPAGSYRTAAKRAGEPCRIDPLAARGARVAPSMMVRPLRSCQPPWDTPT